MNVLFTVFSFDIALHVIEHDVLAQVINPVRNRNCVLSSTCLSILELQSFQFHALKHREGGGQEDRGRLWSIRMILIMNFCLVIYKVPYYLP